MNAKKCWVLPCGWWVRGTQTSCIRSTQQKGHQQKVVLSSVLNAWETLSLMLRWFWPEPASWSKWQRSDCVSRRLSVVENLFGLQAHSFTCCKSPSGTPFHVKTLLSPSVLTLASLVHGCLESIGEMRNGGEEARLRQMASGIGDLRAFERRATQWISVWLNHISPTWWAWTAYGDNVGIRPWQVNLFENLFLEK